MTSGQLFLLLILLMVVGMPVYGAVALTCVAYMFTNAIDLFMLVQRMYSGTDKLIMIALPGFLIAGNLMDEGGLAKRLVAFCEIFVNKLTGGLAIISIGASAFFGAISGSSVATTTAVGGIMLPEMKKRGYPGGYTAAVAAAGGILGGIIPPSIGIVVYGAATGTSISSLFKAGVSCGLFMALSVMVLSYFYSKKHGFVAQPKKYTKKDVLRISKEAILAIGAPVIILGGIFSGLFTPTEASIVSVFYTLIVCGLCYKELSWQKVWKAFEKAAISSAAIMVIIATANLFGWIIAFEKVPEAILSVITAITSNKYVLLLIINVFLLIAGMFMSGTAIILITTPILCPIANALGINPIQFGIMMLCNLGIGQISPPFGTCLYAGSYLSEEPVEAVAKHLIPFMAVYFIDVLIIMVWPAISLCLI